MSEIPNEIFQPLEEQEQQVFKLGTVTNLFENGTAQVLFDGETEPSQKQYAFLSTYRPAVDDRVFLAAIGGTYVIMGAITHEASQEDPEDPDAGNFTTLNVSGTSNLNNLIVGGSSSLSTLSVSGTTELAGTLLTEGNAVIGGNIVAFTAERMGFFGKSAIYRPTVTRPSNLNTLNDAFTWLSRLAMALHNLGLITDQYF